MKKILLAMFFVGSIINASEYEKPSKIDQELAKFMAPIAAALVVGAPALPLVDVGNKISKDTLLEKVGGLAVAGLAFKKLNIPYKRLFPAEKLNTLMSVVGDLLITDGIFTVSKIWALSFYKSGLLWLGYDVGSGRTFNRLTNNQPSASHDNKEILKPSYLEKKLLLYGLKNNSNQAIKIANSIYNSRTYCYENPKTISVAIASTAVALYGSYKLYQSYKTSESNQDSVAEGQS